jgi:hypothetical protein
LGLKHFRIPSSVVEIGDSAFACCRQLMSVHLLSNLRTIEEEPFRACDSLTHVRIPSSVTRIEHAAIHVAHFSSSLFLHFSSLRHRASRASFLSLSGGIPLHMMCSFFLALAPNKFLPTSQGPLVQEVNLVVSTRPS